MKKIIILSTIGIILSLNLGMVQARLGLPEDLRPTHSPTINITTGRSLPGGEVGYGNFILQLIAGSLLYLAGPVAILFIVIGGTSYVISHGKQESMEKAKKTITWAIIGLVVIIFSYSIIQAVIGFVLQAG